MKTLADFKRDAASGKIKLEWWNAMEKQEKKSQKDTEESERFNL